MLIIKIFEDAVEFRKTLFISTFSCLSFLIHFWVFFPLLPQKISKYVFLTIQLLI